ncbi:hypothetical protein [Rugamonas rubra]|uniref:Uncharacterized protein n=1 Tax=Rugamonas rubra TaxID=758825 RepID=A0A1I4LXJ7_9BURK|nr:hypothetical protein [Rugamonas rubra]SFL95690.1 hypothetical protein SAMN02982985_02107 [Rugamonas rubra]
MHFSRKLPRRWVGLLLTLLLHLALLYSLLLGKPAPQREDGQAARPAMQWLLPPPPKRAAPIATPPPTAPSRPIKPAKPAAATLLPPPPQAIAAPAEAPAAEPAAALPAEPVFGAAPPSAADVMRQPKRDLGKIDLGKLEQELRKEFPQRGVPQQPPDSKQARLERGINAAHEAVPPKWYEPARMVELSQPNSQVRVYKVSTALGAYCITVKEDGKKNFTTCPR